MFFEEGGVSGVSGQEYPPRVLCISPFSSVIGPEGA